MVSITIETITPETAKKFLLANRHNRPLKLGWINTLSDAIRRGEWRLNGEAIKFCANGDLLDGQNRLYAIARSGVPVEAAVVRGLPHEVFDTIDQGVKRSASDIFALRGEKSTGTLAAACKFACFLEEGCQGPLSKVRTVKELEAILERHPSLRSWSTKFSNGKARTIAPSATAAVLAFGARIHDDEVADSFLHGLATGENLSAKSPIRLLRERLIDMQLHPVKRVRQEIRNAYVVKAWNAFANGTTLRIMRFSPDNESFPIVE